MKDPRALTLVKLKLCPVATLLALVNCNLYEAQLSSPVTIHFEQLHGITCCGGLESVREREYVRKGKEEAEIKELRRV